MILIENHIVLYQNKDFIQYFETFRILLTQIVVGDP